MQENNLKKAVKYISFLFYPWLSLFISLKSLNTKSSYNVIFGFCVLFGLAFSPSFYSELDSSWYYRYFIDNSDISFRQYTNYVKTFFSKDNESKDIYVHTMTFIVSCFSQNVRFLFGGFAIVFSFLYLKSLRYLTLNKLFVNNSVVCLLLFVIFTLSNPIFNINGARFWTASWLAIYISLSLIIREDKRYLFLCALLPLIHASFWAYIGLLIIHLFFKNNRILIIGFFVSFVLSGGMLAFVQDISSFLPDVLARYVEIYTSEGYMQFRADEIGYENWYIRLLRMLKMFYANLLVFVFIRHFKKFKSNNIKNLFSFILLLAIFANLTISIPSVGNRFQMLLYPLITVLWLYNAKELKKNNFLLFLFPIVFLLDFYLLFLNIVEVVDPYFYVSPLFYFIYHVFIL